MSIILNIETATPVCSVCISENNQELITKEITEGQAHAESLTILIQDAFREIGMPMERLSAVAVSKGPGSYTGLRIGLSVAKGICYALDKPLIAIDSLKALAYGTYLQAGIEDALYCPMIDARRMEVYTALYDATFDTPVLDTHAKIIDENSFREYIAKERQIILSGDGAEKSLSVLHYQQIIHHKIISSARFLIDLSHKSLKSKIFCDLLYIQPSYHKKPNITVAKKKL